MAGGGSLIQQKINKALTLLEQGDWQKARSILEKVVAKARNNIPANGYLGMIYGQTGEHAKAARCFRKILDIEPNNIEALSNLAISHTHTGDYAKSVPLYKKLLKLNPKNADVLSSLGYIYNNIGCPDKTREYYDRYLQLQPADQVIRSTWLLVHNYLEDQDKTVVCQKHCDWETHLADGTVTSGTVNQTGQHEKIRIAYVSPDFRDHSVASFIGPILAHHDKSRFEIICYSCADNSDDTTTRLKQHADLWRELGGQDDRRAEETIRKDAPDILIDLAGHTKNNLLRLFARRLAPVQISYLGYPNTTGLSTMDYRITDVITDPEEENQYYAEKLLRISPCFLAYQPHETGSPDYAGKSADDEIIFGSFNHLNKISDITLDTWCDILRQVPNSKLVIKTRPLKYELARTILRKRIDERGIDSGRVELRAWMPSKAEHLALYNSIDIALDTFPYNGTTTTCEALSMGIPVVTLSGDRHAARVSESILRSCDLPDLVASDVSEYVNLCIRLANEPEELVNLHARVRNRFFDSPLLQHKEFVVALENQLLTLAKA